MEEEDRLYPIERILHEFDEGGKIIDEMYDKYHGILPYDEIHRLIKEEKEKEIYYKAAPYIYLLRHYHWRSASRTATRAIYPENEGVLLRNNTPFWLFIHLFISQSIWCWAIWQKRLYT